MRAWLSVAAARMQGCAFTDDCSQPLYLGYPGVFDAVAKGAGCSHNWILEKQAAFMLRGQFGLQVHWLSCKTKQSLAPTRGATTFLFIYAYDFSLH